MVMLENLRGQVESQYLRKYIVEEIHPIREIYPMRGLIHDICTYAGWEIKVLNQTVQVIVLGFIFVVS